MVVESVEACLPPRGRIVDAWTARFPERWAVLVGEVRDVALAEHAVAVGAVRAAIGEREPSDPAGLAEIEGLSGVHPGNALAAVIPPSTVWDYDLALEAAGAVGDRQAAIASIGFGSFARCEPRLRDRVARVERQLPFRASPRASAVLAEGCDLFATRSGFDAELACAVLEAMCGCSSAGSPPLTSRRRTESRKPQPPRVRL